MILGEYNFSKKWKLDIIDFFISNKKFFNVFKKNKLVFLSQRPDWNEMIEVKRDNYIILLLK